MSERDADDDPIEILLVEDNPGDVRLIEEMLADARDRSAVTAGTGGASPSNLRHVDRLDDGLQTLGEEAIDVVLLDLGLPDSTGIDTLETVRDRFRDVPIVVLTGLDDERVGDRAVQQGAQEYLVKNELSPALLRRSLRHAIERKKFERTQAALHRASRDLIKTESASEVSQVVVDTAVDVLDLSGIAIYLFDGSANLLRPAAYTEYVRGIFGELPSFGPDDMSITWQAFIDGEPITYEDVLESEHVHRRDTPLQSGIWIPLGDHGVIAIVSEAGGGFDQRTHQLADHLAATAEAALDRVEREASLHDQERELAQRNRQLEELNRTNELIREIDQVLVQATTREAIEQAVCELLTQTKRFAFAWIGEAVDDERLRPRTSAGSDQGYLDAVSLTTDADPTPPAVTAMSTETATLTANVAANLRGAPWRTAALARDLQSVISVPLTYNELSYGVLTVYANEPGAFDARSRDVFAELGETIANAINAVGMRQTLLTDTVVELELAIHEPDDLLARLAREAGCEIEYGGTVPHAGDTTRIFFRASGGPASAIRAVAEEISTIQQLDVISDADGDGGAREHRFEMTVLEPTIPSMIVESGAVARSLTVTESELRVTVELPDTTDVRTFIDRIEERYPETELVARRDRERSSDSLQPSEDALAERLSDRQLEALQTAYLSGYFEWPRDRTGEEVAASLGITQPTFNGHLRAAERKLCAMMFDGPTGFSGDADQHT